MVKIVFHGDGVPETFIMGFRGIGQVGYYSILYLLRHLPFKKRGLVETSYIHPVVIVGDDRDLHYPIEIYSMENYGLIRIEDIPLNKAGANLLKKIIKWMVDNGAERLILIGGLVSSLKEDEDEEGRIVHNSYFNDDIGIKYAHRDVRILGPLAYALYYAELYQLPALGILAYADANRPVDLMGVYNALKILKDVTGLDIDLEEILMEAHTYEEQISELEKEFSDRESKGMYT